MDRAQLHKVAKAIVTQYIERGEANRVSVKTMASIAGMTPSALSNARHDKTPLPRADVWLAMLKAIKEFDKLADAGVLPLPSRSAESQQILLRHFGIVTTDQED